MTDIGSSEGLPRLIVQSEERVIELITEELAEDTESIERATTLSDALRLTWQRPALVLLGLDLPDSQGAATFHSFTGQRADHPVLVVSHHPREPIGHELIRAGATEYMNHADLGHRLLPTAIQVSLARWQRRRQLAEVTVRTGMLSARMSSAQPMLYEAVRRIERLAEDLSTSDDPALERLSPMVTEVAYGFRHGTFYSFKDGFGSWLRQLAGMATTRSGPRIQVTGDLSPLPTSVDRHVRAAAQELLVNALRHASASSIVVEVTRSGRNIRVRTTDDGCGFGGATASGNGQSNLERRAAKFGGGLRRSRHDGLTRVDWWVSIPTDSGWPVS
ncbi:MAG: hypothetical protein OEW42_19220 [Acidimicrobiia bacterium]|nr:hypothetical protein [Acidimicrobiia bacterium]